MSDQTKAIKKFDQFKITLRSDAVRERFETILNERAEAFLSSLLSVVANDDALQKCDPGSILTAAAKAAILNLPVEKSLGFAWIIPFKDTAEFVMGYKGYIQLALRTSFYEAINATPVYEGEQVNVNRLTGNITLNGAKTGDEVIGFASYFKMKNGFEKYIYMTVAEVHAHAKRYSKSYSYKNLAWKTNFNDMGKKTVIRQLLSKWGLLSIEMQDSDVDISMFPTNGNERLTETEDLVVPEFGEIVEGEAVDAEPSEDDIYQAVVDAGLSENVHAAKKALAKCKTGYETPEMAIAWMTAYRGFRDMGGTVAQAAKQVNEGNVPK